MIRRNRHGQVEDRPYPARSNNQLRTPFIGYWRASGSGEWQREPKAGLCESAKCGSALSGSRDYARGA